MKSNPLISVIIPVYNVEQYLRKCVESVMRQTYNNLEIMLVIDGEMNDRSAEICDEMACEDDRLFVEKISHGGLAYVRNYGISRARGEYISFVDSDDWVEPTMIEDMYDEIQNNCVSIAVCGYYREIKGKSIECCTEVGGVVDARKALEMLGADQLQNYAWNKLYKKELFEGITFPVERLFEDIAVMHLIFDRAKRIVLVAKPEYHYLIRKNSIVSQRNLEGRLDALEMIMHQYAFVLEKYPESEKCYAESVFKNFVSLAVSSFFSGVTSRRNSRTNRAKLTRYYSSRRDIIFSSLKTNQRIILQLIWADCWVQDCIALTLEYIRRKL